MKTKTLHFILVFFIALFLGYFIGINKISLDWKNYSPKLEIVNKEPPVSQSRLDLAPFWTVLEKVQQSYYDKKAIDSEKLLNGAISGMVQSVGDPYTVYLPPVQNAGFKEGLAGQFEGIGAELGFKDKQIIVVSPLDGMPAEKAGIRSGDAILKVDNASTVNWTLAQAVEKIRGKKGTTVDLLVLHRDEEKPKTIKVTRNTITVKSVSGWLKSVKDIPNITIKNNGSDKIMYLRLSQFGDNSNQEWLAMVNKLLLEAKNKGQAKGVVFDLRNNPGGYLTDATYIASEFIKDGNVVIQDKGNGEKTPFAVNRVGLLLDIPVIVLINKGSASASEIVAGALRDHKRAILLGETSFGKGTIQQSEDLGSGSGLHVTIAKWLTPNGTWVGDGKDGVGLKPDIIVELDEKNPTHDTQLERAIQELLK